MGNGHHHHHHHESGKNLLVAFFLNAGFSIVEFVGAYFTNSIAVYSDALHDLGDSIALLFAYFAEKISRKGADRKFTYGYRRFSVLSAMVNGLILFFGSLYVLYEALMRLQSPEPVNPEGMLLMGFLGVAVNGLAVYKLSGSEGLNQKMVMYHLLEDLMGWGAVILVSVILLFRPWYFLDSVLSIIISFIILRGVYQNLLKVGSIILQKFPDDLEIDRIVSRILDMEKVKDVHAIKGWSMDELTFSVSFHVVVPDDLKMAEVDTLKREIKAILASEKVRDSAIEFEGEGFQC